jgi:hypothetical protein
MMKSNRKGGWVSLTLLHQMDHSVSAGRLLKYDIIRITAIFFVLLTHASGVLLFMFPDASTEEFRIANIFNGLSRCPDDCYNHQKLCKSKTILFKFSSPFPYVHGFHFRLTAFRWTRQPPHTVLYIADYLLIYIIDCFSSTSHL